MAIADAEPKKGDVDVTSTGSGSGSKEMKKPRGPIKYSSLKDFSFSVSDVWDDRNICTFIECCHANFEDLKNHNGSEENKVWEKIAKSGLERSGSVNCFNVNYCLELARCLKSFVSKNEQKMMDNEIFKLLYENVVELLPYFAPVSASRQRSRSKSVENSKPEKNEAPANTNKGDHLTIPPFGSSPETTQAVRKISKVLNKYKLEEFVKTSSRNAIWKEVTTNVEKDFGVSVNPRMFLEGYKRSVVGFVRSHPDPKERAKIFLEQVDDLLPFFDHLAPKSMKKSEFLNHAVTPVPKESPLNVDLKKRKENEEENVELGGGSSSPKGKKRLNSGGESLADSCDIPLTTNTTTPLRTYLKKKTVSGYESKAKRSKYGEDSEESCSGALDFLDEWNCGSGTDDLVETPQEKTEPEKEKPIETEPLPVEAPVHVPKKRGRKPKNANAVSETKSDPAPAKKVLPRRGNRSQKDTAVDASENEHGKPDSEAPSSKELVPAARILPIKKDELPENKDPGVPSKHTTEIKKKATGPTIISSETFRHNEGESDDSDVEDVPLMGTNIRVHTIRGKVEQSKSHSIKGNMNPVVLLDKLSTESYLSSARTKPIPKSFQTHGKTRTKETSRERNSGEASTSQDFEPTPTERRRGRPRKPSKTPIHRTRAVPPRREATPVQNINSAELVRQPAQNIQSRDRSLIVRELETRPSTFRRDLMPLTPPSSSISESFVSRSHSDLNPPEWFERFVMETRRHEMWKVHQLMKMQQELLDSEYKKRGVLDKILSALNERS